MTWRHRGRGLRACLLAVGVAVLAACAGGDAIRGPERAAHAAQEAREQELAERPVWSLTGRLAVSDGRDGGSGTIRWHQRGDRFTIELRAPVSRRSWRLSGEPGRVRLEGLEGGPRTGSDARALLREALGWDLPVADLRAWARGARGAGHAVLEFDAAGRPARLQQHGWTVEYREWTGDETPLPRRIFAANGERRVRLVVSRWDAGLAP